ncbi:MAG: ATP-binding cassette domain-containing protein [Clostridia bacterium]|nr:ATP-binding cassette domain-containing protein [Clostridia bacterium]
MRIENLTKKYGDNTVYENFNLEIEEGEITCILGESGSGKTTLLNCIAGLTDFDGTIPKLKCSYVFQNHRLVPCLTVFENLALVCPDKEKIESVLNDLHFSDKRDEYPLKLSGGQAQRASLARALVFGGDIMLMDEPFSSLDLKLKKDITAQFKKLHQDLKFTAIFVTHDIDEALELGARIVVINNGKIVLDKKNVTKSRKEIISALLSA